MPVDQVGPEWMPGLAVASDGTAVVGYGRDDPVVAVPTRHDPIRLADRQAVVRFVARDSARLDAERIDTELGAMLVTSAERQYWIW